MSNPVGYADHGGIAGIDGSSFVQLLPDGFDPTIAGSNIGGFYYTRPLAPEPTTDSEPECSSSPLNATGLSGTLYPYVQHRLTGSFDQTQSSDIALEAAGTAAPDAFVTLQVLVAVNTEAGQPRCTDDFATFDPTTWSLEILSMGGSPAILGESDVPRPALDPGLPSSSLTTFHTLYYLLRTTAHSWPGQDPDNLANRIFWRPSEIGTTRYRLSGSAAAISGVFSWFVKSWLPTTFPSTCLVRGAPGNVAATPSAGGIRPRGWRPPVMP